jgi:hypothetical protein
LDAHWRHHPKERPLGSSNGEERMTDRTLTEDKHMPYIMSVVRYVGFDSFPPDNIRDYLLQLKKQGYTELAAANCLRKLLQVNEL